MHTTIVLDKSTHPHQEHLLNVDRCLKMKIRKIKRSELYTILLGNEMLVLLEKGTTACLASNSSGQSHKFK